MAKPTANEKAYYVLGITQVMAERLAKEINEPVENCRDFLLSQVIKYLKNQSRPPLLEDMITHGLLKE